MALNRENANWGHSTLTQKLNKDVESFNIRADQHSSDDEKLAIEVWLSAENPAAIHAAKAQKRQKNTGQWFLDKTESWKSGDRRRLWCLGMPGAGKTVLASQMVDHICETLLTEDKRIGHVYFNYKERLTQTADDVYRGLLKQLSQQSRTLSPHIKYLRDLERNLRKFPGREHLRRMLLQELQMHPEVWLVIDALDECRNDDGTRDDLLETLRQAPDTVRWLITSRDLPAIRESMDENDTSEKEPLTISANEEDVRRYVEGRIDRNADFKKKVKKFPSLKTTVIEEVSKSVRGMCVSRLFACYVCGHD